MNWLFRPSFGLAFKTRSSGRDIENDRRAIESISNAIDLALNQAETEKMGLNARLEDIVSRAALVGGNDTNDFMTRAKDRQDMLRRSDAEIRRGQERLVSLDQNIVNFRFLKTALEGRFARFFDIG